MKIINQKINFISPKSWFAFIIKRFYIFFILALIYIPLIVIVLLSFNGQTDKGNIIMNFSIPQMDNYLILFKNNEFLNVLFNSLIVSLIVVPVSVIIGTITCFGIWKAKTKYTFPIISISKVSIGIPEPITAISLALLFIATIVPLGLDFGLFTICLAHITFCTPYAIISIYPKMQKMPKNLIWASYDLGYSKIKTFLKIVVPYLLPSLFSACAITLAMSLDDFIITNLINGSFQTLSTAIYSTRKGIKAWVITFGSIVVLTTFIIVIFTTIYKISKNKNNYKFHHKKENK